MWGWDMGVGPALQEGTTMVTAGVWSASGGLPRTCREAGLGWVSPSGTSQTPRPFPEKSPGAGSTGLGASLRTAILAAFPEPRSVETGVGRVGVEECGPGVARQLVTKGDGTWMGLDRQRAVPVTETTGSCANGFIGLSLESTEALLRTGPPSYLRAWPPAKGSLSAGRAQSALSLR